MRHRPAALVFVMALVACAGTRLPSPTRPPPPAPVAPEPDEPEPDKSDAALATDGPSPMTPTVVEAPERSRPPSTASYDEALSKPEPVEISDDHEHLTDVQLTSPMGGALVGCRVPANAKIRIKTAVQYGRAIGVTVDVHIQKPKSTKRPKPEAIRAEQKAIAKLAACVDHNVRAVVWPPNRRRDSFTTDL